MDQKSDKRSGIITAGFVLGIIGVVLSAIPIINNFAAVLGLLALIFGIVGIAQTRRSARSGRGLAITSLILGIVTIGIVIISQMIYSAALDTVSKSIDKSTGNSTSELLNKDVTVTFGDFTATTDQYGLTTTKLPVTVMNKDSDKKSYSIQIEGTDASGARIDDDTLTVNDLGAKQSQELTAFEFVDSAKVTPLKTASFKVVSVSQY